MAANTKGEDFNITFYREGKKVLSGKYQDRYTIYKDLSIKVNYQWLELKQT